MSAPNPLTGTTNPFTAAYQNRQFKVTSLTLPGSNAVHNSLTGPQNVFDALTSPPTAGTNAVAGSDPLEDSAEFWLLNPQVLTVNGTPSGGTFTLAWGAAGLTGTIAENATSGTVQTAVQTITALNAVTVAGAAGGPWTLTGSQLTGQLIVVASNNLTGGTYPNVSVTSPAGQAGISPF